MAIAFSPADYRDKVDSLYRLVIICSRRASQISKPENRPLVPVKSKKATMVALDEVREGKVTYELLPAGEDEFAE
jgi:DNA-directed RNA polymerase omega subunit